MVNWRKMTWDDQPILLVSHIHMALDQNCSQAADAQNPWVIVWSQQRAPAAVLRVPVFCTLKWSPSPSWNRITFDI